MNADDHRRLRTRTGDIESRLRHASLTEQILGAFYEVYNELGRGFLESVYGEALAVALSESGVPYERETRLTVTFRGVVVGTFRPDFLIDSKVLVELKAASALDDGHVAQVLNYLRATALEVALVLNFGPQPTFKRLCFDNTRKSQGPR
jgi:GxxExxY protein